MGILERLGNVIKSYINDDTEHASGRRSQKTHEDPDYAAAWEELENDLNRKESREKEWDELLKDEKSGTAQNSENPKRKIPEELMPDFTELGLSPEASAEECKEAYKKLIKIHHPDRHANHAENMRKATDKTARVNASYGRLAKWFKLSP